LAQIRPAVSSLWSDNIVSDDEQKELLNYFANASTIDSNTMQEAANLTSESEQVLKRLRDFFKEDIVEQERPEPVQPASEPQLPASLVSEMLAGGNL
jgi:hypothetical protein